MEDIFIIDANEKRAPIKKESSKKPRGILDEKFDRKKQAKREKSAKKE